MDAPNVGATLLCQFCGYPMRALDWRRHDPFAYLICETKDCNGNGGYWRYRIPAVSLDRCSEPTPWPPEK